MRICICYIAVSHGPIVDDYCARFVTTYQEYPPGYEHDTIVICNGGPLRTSTTLLFSGMDAMMFPRENDPGWDVSGYLAAARGPCSDYDMMLCLGESIYFFKPGWLKRLVDASLKYGPGFYGVFSSNAVSPHLQTSAFFCSPELLRQYPQIPKNRGERMEFEYGQRALWRRTVGQGKPVRLVTWDGEWEPRLWRVPRNILWRGTQDNLLMINNHAEGFFYADDKTKSIWSKRADSPFR